jgi:hypothetical protein
MPGDRSPQLIAGAGTGRSVKAGLGRGLYGRMHGVCSHITLQLFRIILLSVVKRM